MIQPDVQDDPQRRTGLNGGLFQGEEPPQYLGREEQTLSEILARLDVEDVREIKKRNRERME